MTVCAICLLVPTEGSNLVGKKGNGKATPVVSHGDPYGCWTSRVPNFLENRLTDGKVVSLMRPPLFTAQEDSSYSFLLEAKSTPGPQ
jgi:hypothetical protein